MKAEFIGGPFDGDIKDVGEPPPTYLNRACTTIDYTAVLANQIWNELGLGQKFQKEDGVLNQKFRIAVYDLDTDSISRGITLEDAPELPLRYVYREPKG